MKYVQGDLLKAPQQVILQGCNAQGKMNSGVAKAIREKYPKVFDVYRKVYDQEGLQLGDVIICRISENFQTKKYILNCITQEYYGRDGKKYVDYDAIAISMNAVREFCIEHGYSEVALPKIGAGLGGGSWDEIAPIIEKSLAPINPIIYQL